MSAVPPPSPDQLAWVLDNNAQIRAGHRVQISNAVAAWRADRQLCAELMEALKAVETHHLKINARSGRDESRSHTLALIRTAIAKAEGR